MCKTLIVKGESGFGKKPCSTAADGVWVSYNVLKQLKSIYNEYLNNKKDLWT